MADKVTLNVPQGKIKVGDNGLAYIQYNPNFKPKMEKVVNKTQIFVDNEVIKHLQAYVSFRQGTQALSIKLSSRPGSGEVYINVPYAAYQAYSPRIKKMVGKRGKQPFERMKSDKKDVILKGASEISRRYMNE